MVHHHELLSGKNLVWLIVIAVVVAVIIILVMHGRDNKEALEGDGRNLRDNLRDDLDKIEDDLKLNHMTKKDRRVLLIVGAVVVVLIIVYGVWHMGYFKLGFEHGDGALGVSASVGSAKASASLRSQSSRSVRSPPRATPTLSSRSPARSPARGQTTVRSQSPFLTNEERSASIRSPARGSLSSLSTEV